MRYGQEMTPETILVASTRARDIGQLDCRCGYQGARCPRSRWVIASAADHTGPLVIGGGEPTLRPDLPALIGHFGSTATPATDGLALHRADAVQTLTRQGLSRVRIRHPQLASRRPRLASGDSWRTSATAGCGPDPPCRGRRSRGGNCPHSAYSALPRGVGCVRTQARYSRTSLSPHSSSVIIGRQIRCHRASISHSCSRAWMRPSDWGCGRGRRFDLTDPPHCAIPDFQELQPLRPPGESRRASKSMWRRHERNTAAPAVPAMAPPVTTFPFRVD